jgi:hypothetical protein
MRYCAAETLVGGLILAIEEEMAVTTQDGAVHHEMLSCLIDMVGRFGNIGMCGQRLWT